MRRIFILMLPLVAAACDGADSRSYQGYVEAEPLRIAATSTGLLARAPMRGDTAEAGRELFSLDLASLTAARDSAAAGVTEAEARLSDVTTGLRPEERQSAAARVKEATAALTNAAREKDRAESLVKQGTAPPSRLDAAKSTYDQAAARLTQAQNALALASQGARTDQIRQAQALLTQRQQVLADANKRLSEAAPVAPATGVVEDVYFRPGEVVPAGQPVVSLLPPANIKLRFFVPEPALQKLKPGQRIRVSCDGCAAGMTARISHIAAQAEFTPPVIYSVGNREKLMFRVEAVPEAGVILRPGLPVDVTP